MRLPILLLGCCVALTAHADIYKRVDASGQVTYTDQPINGSKRMNLVPLVTPAAASASHKNSSRKAIGSAPSGFPRVDASTQNKRDSLRRTVLQSELHTEQQAWAEAMSAKKDGETLRLGEQASSPGYLSRLNKLDETIKLHQDNIHSLDKELGSIK